MINMYGDASCTDGMCTFAPQRRSAEAVGSSSAAQQTLGSAARALAGPLVREIVHTSMQKLVAGQTRA